MNSDYHSDVFDQNMEQLKISFPEIYNQLDGCEMDIHFTYQVIATSSGYANITATLADGNIVHFYEDADLCGGIRAMMADWQLETEDFLFCIGIGLGYVPLLASQTFSGRPQLVVIEPSPEIFLLAMRTTDLRALLSYGRLDLCIGPNLPVAEIIAKHGEQIFFGKNRLVSHGPSRVLHGESFRSLENEVVENIRVTRNIGYTAKYGGQKIFSNTMKNLPNLFSGPDLKSLEGRFRGCPAICVAAGPSLDNDLALLKTVGNRALLLSADSAVRSLVGEGIRPHMVVTTDMNPINFEKLRTSLGALRESVLVFSIEANPDNVGTFLGPRRIAVTSKNAILNDWMGPKWSLDWQIPAMTSVSHACLFTAIALGAAPIILVGMDFAYSCGKSHASGSVFRYPTDIEKAIQVDGVRGYPVHSLPQLINDRKQIENVMDGSPVRLIDTSLDGALIRGAENRSLKEVMDTMLQKEMDVSSVLESIDWAPSVDNQAISMEFEAMTERLDRFISVCQTQLKTCRSQRKSGAKPDGHYEAQLAGQIRGAMPAFDRNYDQLLSLLKLLRYDDVKEISRRLVNIRANPGTKTNRKDSVQIELAVYADYFASLEKAARQFRSALIPIRRLFDEESKLIKNIDNGDFADDQILDLADCYRKCGLFWKAERAFIRYIEKRPSDIEVWLSMGRMLAQKGLWSLAQTCAGQMKIRFPGDKKIGVFESEIALAIMDLRDSAAVSLDAGDIEEARRKLNEYICLAGEDNIGQTLQKKIDAYDKHNTGAMRQIEPLQMSAEKNLTLNERVGECLENREIEKAIGVLEGLAQYVDKKAWHAREKIGDIRLSRGDVFSAVWHYRQALELTPGKDTLVSKINMALRQTTEGKNHMENLTVVKIARETDEKSVGESPEEMYRQAHLKIEQAAYPDAVHALEQLLARYPDFGLAHNDLGVLYYKQGDTEKSFWHYQKAAHIEPGNPVFQKNLADFYYIVKGCVQNALEIYVDLLSKNPMDKETLLALGQICMDQEKFDDAAVFYGRIQEFDPTDTDADRGLAELSDRRKHAAPNDTQPDQGNRLNGTTPVSRF